MGKCAYDNKARFDEAKEYASQNAYVDKEKLPMVHAGQADYENKKRDSKGVTSVVSIIPLNEIERIMSKYGRYKRYEKEHKRFKADSKRNYLKDTTIEYIHCLEKENIN